MSIFTRAVQAWFACCHAIELFMGLMVVVNPGTFQVRVDGMIDHHLPSKSPQLSIPRTAVQEERLVDFLSWLATCSQLPWSEIDHQLQIILPESARNQFGGCDTATISSATISSYGNNTPSLSSYGDYSLNNYDNMADMYARRAPPYNT